MTLVTVLDILSFVAVVGSLMWLKPAINERLIQWIESPDWDEIFDDAIEYWGNGRRAIRDFKENIRDLWERI